MSNTTILLGMNKQESYEDICLGSNIRKRMREYGYDSLGHDGTLGKLFRQGMFNVSKARKAGADKFLMDIFQKKVMNAGDNKNQETEEENLEGIPIEAIIQLVQGQQSRDDARQAREQDARDKEEDRKLERERLASQVRTIHLQNINPNLPPTGFGMLNPMTLMAMASALQSVAPVVNQKTKPNGKPKKIQGKELLSLLSTLNRDNLKGFLSPNVHYRGLDSGTKILLQFGSRNDYVKDLQNKLNEVGENAGKADGIFGKNTKQAVINFQIKNDLKPDGIVGAKTLEKLYPKRPMILIDPEPIITMTPTIPPKEFENPVFTQQEIVPEVPKENIMIEIPPQSPGVSPNGVSDYRVPTKEELIVAELIKKNTGENKIIFHHSPVRMFENSKGFYSAVTGKLIKSSEELKENNKPSFLPILQDNHQEKEKEENDKLVKEIKRESLEGKIKMGLTFTGVIILIILIIKILGKR